MADWYVSSAAYATYTAFQTSHAYIIGDLIVPTAPAAKAKYVFRCTTAGSSTTEPAWTATNNATSTSGTAVFTNVTGQSTFFWTAAAGDLASMLQSGTQRVQGGDRVFISSDHNATVTGTQNYGAGIAGTNSYSIAQYLSVNRAGSTPPVAADVLAGATETVSSNTLSFNLAFPSYHYGITYIYTGSTATNSIVIGTTGNKSIYLDTCQLYLNTVTSTCAITAQTTGTLTLNNTTLRFGSTSQVVSVTSNSYEFNWINTPSAIAGATIPSVLFAPSGASTCLFTCRGVDLSAITGTLVQNSSNSSAGCKWLFDSCKIASGVVRYSSTNITTASTTRDEVELVGCYDGTNIISERYQQSGTLTTETTITLSGGATDDVGTYSHKMVSTANLDKFIDTFNSFWLGVENTALGSSKTATVEIISSGTLKNDEISLLLEYRGTSSSSVASFGSSFILTPLTTPSSVTTSTATWNSSPATPQKQKLQVTFTPQTAGIVRGIVRLGLASTTVYVNPQITVT